MSTPCPFCGSEQPNMAHTASEVKDAIIAELSKEENIDRYGDPLNWRDWWSDPNTPIRIKLDDGSYDVHIEDQYMGEGDGVLTFVIVKIGDQFFKQEGYYTSYDGNDWEGDFREVAAYEEIRRVWKTP